MEYFTRWKLSFKNVKFKGKKYYYINRKFKMKIQSFRKIRVKKKSLKILFTRRIEIIVIYLRIRSKMTLKDDSFSTRVLFSLV